MYNTYSKGNNDEDPKEKYIWLSCTLAVVTSAAVRGPTNSRVL